MLNARHFLLFVLCATALPCLSVFDFQEIDALLNRGRKQKIFPGAVALIWYQGKVVYHKAFGRYTYQRNSPRVTLKTQFDVASLTKLLTTASAMLLVDAQKIRLNDRICTYLPELKNNGKETIRISHLLTHTSGLHDDALHNHKEGVDILETLHKCAAHYIPGKKFHYTDTNMILLQKIIERVSGKPLDEFIFYHITRPLGMHHTMFNPHYAETCAPTRAQAPQREYLLQGEVDDDRAYLFDGVSGHAGIFSTAEDFAKFMLMLLSHGCYAKNNHRYQLVNPYTVAQWTQTRVDFTKLGHAASKRGYGFEIGRHLSDDAFGHFGWTGTSAWVDRERGLICILFTNRVHPTYADSGKMMQMRKEFHDLVVKCIEK